MRQVTVYLILEFGSSLLFSWIFTVNQLYQLTFVELNPLQLVLVGTVLEFSVFVFEIPTGVLADLKSRRLSVIVGYVLIGLGFVFEATFPHFWAVALAQVIWGCGYTFTSGATQAWIADEIGEAHVGQVFLRGEQAAQAGALVAIPVSVAFGTIDIRLPIVIGGALMILLAGFLSLVMREDNFRPTPLKDRATWNMMFKTLRDARMMVRRQPVLLALLGIGLFYGLYSEGLDRLWIAHLLDDFKLPFFDVVQPVVWFGIMRGVEMVVSLAAVEAARRRVDTGRGTSIARTLLLGAGLIVAALVVFALTKSFALAVVAFWLVGALRSVAAPLQTAWLNLRIDDSKVRATLFSVSGQVDAVGQIAGGPAVGVIGNASIRAALLVSALLLLPVLPLYAVAIRQDEPVP
jgi:DHA3 family tetracycline resistance protein-like MFS transporter